MTSSFITPSKPLAYHGLIRTIHWLVALLVTVAVTAVLIRGGFDKPTQTLLMRVHQSAGLLIFVLVPIRLCLRFLFGVPDLPETNRKWLLRLPQYVLYFLMMLVPILGLLYVNARGGQAQPFGLFAVPSLIDAVEPKEAAQKFAQRHVVMAFLTLALIALHALAALFHHFTNRRGTLLLSMLTSTPRRR